MILIILYQNIILFETTQQYNQIKVCFLANPLNI